MGDIKEETSQMVKVHNISGRGTKIEEVDVEKAKRIIAEARAQGRLVINKKMGEVIEDLKPNVKEVLIVDLVGGG